jgi:putative DNA primase/helicase
MPISIKQAQALVIEFCAAYPVAATIGFKIRETQEELYGPHATREAAGTILGSFHPGQRRALFATANCHSDDEFKRSLRHEILGHFGLNTFSPGDKRAVLTAIIDARTQSGLDKFWAHVDRHYPGLDDMRKAEEVFAFACEDIDPDNRSAAVYGNRSFKEVCASRIRPLRVSDLINLTTMVAQGLHDRTRSQQTFPESDSAQFKQDSPMKTSEYPVWLAVQADERDKMRAAAGQLSDGRSAVAWDKVEKLWYARPGCDLDRINEWLPDRSMRAGGGDPEAQFLDALTQAGLVIKGMPVMNGVRQRVPTIDDKGGSASGAYCGYLDRKPAGWFINFQRAASAKDVTNWVSIGGETDPVSRLHIRAAAKQSQEDVLRERALLHAASTAEAKKLYDKLPAADPAHPYLVRKGIPPTPEIRQTRNGALVVPFFSVQGNFKTLQTISESGDKLLFKDAPKKGNFLVVGGPLEPGQPILYAEGYATARSLNLATDRPVVMTIDAGNMVIVAQILHQQFPGSPHLFLADFDHAKAENKGLIMATEAAQLVGGQVLYPAFNESEIARGFTDFNDLHQSRGLHALREHIASLFQPAAQYDEVTTVPDQPDVEAPGIQARPFSQEELQGSVAIPTRDDAYADAAGPSSRFSLEEMQGSVPIFTRPAVEQPAPDVSVEAAPAPAAPEEPITAAEADEIASRDSSDQPARAAEVVEPSSEAAPASVADTAPAAVEPASVNAEEPGTSEPAAVEAPFADLTVASATSSDPATPATPEHVQAGPDTTQLSPVQPTVAASTSLPADEPTEPALTAPVAVASPAPAEPDAPAKVSEDLAAMAPRRPAADEAPAAEAVMDFIDVGPRIGKDEPPLQPSQIDKDNLLSRITPEPQGDNSVLYKLDNEPAFVDRGSRLEMVPGAGQSDEKILAALLTAARFYRGQIELTGSDAFKAKAIELIAQNQVNVSMKNPAQQLMLDQARQALNLPVVKADAIHGDTPAPFDPAPPATPAMNVATAAGSTAPTSPTVPEQQAAPMPVNTAANNAYVPLAVYDPITFTHNAAQAGPVDDAPPLGAARQTSETKAAGVSGDQAPGTGVDPSIHQLSTSAAQGVTGKVLSCGKAPFRFDPENSESVHIKLRTKTGIQTFWGKELAGLLRETRIEPGRMATLQYLGEKPVTVRTPVKDPDTGVVLRYEDKQAKRNQWSLGLLNGTAVRTGDDQGVKLVAYDAARFDMIQTSIMRQLNVPIDAPPRPADGLFWMTPNGQGSAKAGDNLSAPRPPVDEVNVGKPVMSSWSPDGQLDMALFRGDGPYLQGVVRQGDQYQHVLVSLPGHAEAPPMVFNQITEQGLVPIGVGNGINRSGGEPVAREHIAFKLDGDPAVRVGKLDFPAEVPPALHVRLGFDERWKDTSNLPKSAPAAAPTTQPSAMRPA